MRPAPRVDTTNNVVPMKRVGTSPSNLTAGAFPVVFLLTSCRRRHRGRCGLNGTLAGKTLTEQRANPQSPSGGCADSRSLMERRGQHNPASHFPQRCLGSLVEELRVLNAESPCVIRGNFQ